MYGSILSNTGSHLLIPQQVGEWISVTEQGERLHIAFADDSRAQIINIRDTF